MSNGPAANILVVDDEPGMREFLELCLSEAGHRVAAAADGEAALAKLGEASFDLILTDVRMPRLGGLDLLERARLARPDCAVVVMTAFGNVETAVEAMKRGAQDYLIKPFKLDELEIVVRKALEARRIRRENAELKRSLRDEAGFGRLVGSSPAMRKLYALIERVARTRTTVLVTGESGSGKEMIARTIHAEGDRSGGPFVPINCGAIPENLVESELFGHVKGAFTGAVANKEGLFELASGGTLFLDEIGELPLQAQVKLLRALQERAIRRVGGSTDIQIDVRIVAATNRVLEELLAEGRFREDLYYRLNVIELRVPPLRERPEDIDLLAEHFLKKYNRELGRDIQKISNEAMQALRAYAFPGNVRELENLIERAVALETSNVILPETLPLLERRAPPKPAAAAPAAEPEVPPEGADLDAMVAAYERELILKVLERTGGVKKRAAEVLGVSFRSLRYRLEKYGLGGGEEDEGPDREAA